MVLPDTCPGDVVVRIPQHGACVMCDTLLFKPFVSFFYKQLSRDNDDKVEGVSEQIWSQITFRNQHSVVTRT